jgi:hypothetical protein
MSTKLRGSHGLSIRTDDTRKMEDEARKMEAKLQMLRNVMESSDAPKGEMGSNGGRWRSGTQAKPITRNYVKGVIDAPSRKRGPARAAAAPGDAPEPPPYMAQFEPSPAHSERAAPACYEVLGDGQGNDATLRGGAAGNLQAAMSRQSGEVLQVETFLASLNLDRYVSIFIENGFDCMEVVEAMEESHMREIGMAAGHILKLSKKLAELRPPPAAPQVSAGTRRVSFGGVEAKPVPPAAPQADGTGVGGSLWDGGSFNEEESAASFQEALRAWRQGGDSAPAAPAVQESAGPRSPAAVGSFFSSIGGGEMDLERARTPPAAAPPPPVGQGDASTDAHGPAPGDEKLCCYHCYKQFFSKYAVERQCPLPGSSEMRRLCSEACAEAWTQAMQAKLEAQQKRQERLDALMDAQRVIAAEHAAHDAAAATEVLGNIDIQG